MCGRPGWPSTQCAIATVTAIGLPVALQRRECGLIEIGRKHARDFDAGHAPSGGGVQRVLTELRTLAERTGIARGLLGCRGRFGDLWWRAPALAPMAGPALARVGGRRQGAS